MEITEQKTNEKNIGIIKVDLLFNGNITVQFENIIHVVKKNPNMETAWLDNIVEIDQVEIIKNRLNTNYKNKIIKIQINEEVIKTRQYEVHIGVWKMFAIRWYIRHNGDNDIARKNVKNISWIIGQPSLVEKVEKAKLEVTKIADSNFTMEIL